MKNIKKESNRNFRVKECNNKLKNSLEVLTTDLLKQKKEFVSVNTDLLTLSSQSRKIKKSIKKTERSHKGIMGYN